MTRQRNTSVDKHYGYGRVMEQIQAGLRKAGKDYKGVPCTIYGMAGNFHVDWGNG